MKPLDKIIKKNGYTYTQVSKGKVSCIYEQMENEKTIAYEVFLIKIKPERKIGDIILEAKEWFPHDKAFGKWAWTYKTLNKALEKYNILENHLSKK